MRHILCWDNYERVQRHRLSVIFCRSLFASDVYLHSLCSCFARGRLWKAKYKKPLLLWYDELVRQETDWERILHSVQSSVRNCAGKRERWQMTSKWHCRRARIMMHTLPDGSVQSRNTSYETNGKNVISLNNPSKRMNTSKMDEN